MNSLRMILKVSFNLTMGWSGMVVMCILITLNLVVYLDFADTEVMLRPTMSYSK